jgi:hypothetical protein
MMRQALIVAALLQLTISPASAQQGVPSSADTMPAAVVQRFVDAAIARDAAAMAALVAPDAAFASFPDGRVLVQGRDSIQAFYARRLSPLPPEFSITVQPRIVEGQLVIDQEHFTGMPPARSQATWMYLVRNGLIHRAWALDGRPPRPPS